MDTELYKLIQVMADGRFYSGEMLAALFGVTRAAIWKRIQRINENLQFDIDRVPGKGYRLSRPLVLLDQDQIISALEPNQSKILDSLHLLPTVDSTNDFVVRHPVSLPGSCIACIAEQQTAGRGRRGKNWVSVFGENIYLSLGYSFDLPLTQLSGLSIAAGVSVAETLSRHGLHTHGLKWPNDIHLSGRKLAGILVDASGDMEGPSRAVIGIGLNMRLDKQADDMIDQPWTDLSSEMVLLPDRNQLAGDIISSLIAACRVYSATGLQSFLRRWQKYDKYLGMQMDLHRGDEIVSGQYKGLTENGALILETAGDQQIFYAGEVSLRKSSVGF